MFKKREEREELITDMKELVPSPEQVRMVHVYQAIMAQVFVRFTPKMERVKWLMPGDDVSDWNSEEKEYITIHRRGESVKVEVKYYALPYEEFTKDQVDGTLTKLLIEMSKVIDLDVEFDVLVKISLNVYEIMRVYKSAVLVSDLRNFFTNMIVEYDECEMACLPESVIFHDGDFLKDKEDYRVASLSLPWDKDVVQTTGNDWRALTLVSLRNALDPSTVEWPTEKYIKLRDQYAREEIGKDFRREWIKEKMEGEVTEKEVLEANSDHWEGAHEYCFARL